MTRQTGAPYSNRRARKPRRLSAKDHLEAYDFWARYFADPALMANRDSNSTLVKLKRVARRLPLTRHSAVLDVGPGDGTLFRIISGRVSRCCGVDPSVAAVERLKMLHADLTNVEFRTGSATAIPFPDATFDIVVINSVLQALPSRGELETAMRELVRVCKAGGDVFIGELPFRSETDRGVLAHMWRKLREYGPWRFSRLLWSLYARPVLRGEPVLTYPATNLHVPSEEVIASLTALGATVEVSRHREFRRESMTRNDYLIHVTG